MANINLSDLNLYALVQETEQPQVTQPINIKPKERPIPNTQTPAAEPIKPKEVNNQVEFIKITQQESPMFKRSIGGFLIFVAIVVVLAFCIYFTLYRLGWGIGECLNKNYHNCGVLLTPEVAPLTLVGLSALL